jgi:hypothetical protein
MLNTPVALIIFRRPQFTQRVLQAISVVRPRKLFVIADGPRPGHPDDAEVCAATRAIIDTVDWPCELIKDYSDTNLGCGRRPATGISGVFQKVEQAIILEDDCVPSPSFFRYCEELLQRFQDDERVMHIAGSTYQRETLPTPYSYVFSCFNGAWGWATWRRAWQHFDMAVKLWPLLRDTSWLIDILEEETIVPHWADEFERANQRNGDVDYWDHQWTFACWANSGLSIRPRHNLVTNVGCCSDATHTFSPADLRANLPAEEMTFPLNHPPMVLQNRELDRKFLDDIIISQFGPAKSRWQRLRSLAARHTPEIMKQGYRTLVSTARSAPT